MSELISKLINAFNIILKENFADNNDISFTIKDVKEYMHLLDEDLYAIKDIDKYLVDVEISKEMRELINQFKTTMEFNKRCNFTNEEVEKYRKIPVYDYIKSALKRQITLLAQSKKAREYELKNKQLCLKLIKYLQNLDGTRMIGEFQLHKFYDLLYYMKIPEEQQLDINMLLLQYNLQAGTSLELDNKEELIESIDNYNLTEQEAKDLFAQYGYDFDLVESHLKEELLSLGTIDGINAMFTYFKNTLSLHNIKFDEKNNNLVNLLFRSKPEIFDGILTICDGKTSILKLLEVMPSVFVNKGSSVNVVRTKQSKRDSKTNSNSEKNPAGCYEDFMMNINLFKELGYDIQVILLKNADILTIPHERIKRNVEQLRLIGIDLKTDIKEKFKLSALKSTTILLTLDKFIELGELSYIMANPSRFNLEPDSVVFYRLFHVKNHNKTEDRKIEIHHDRRKLMYKGYISNPANTELGITESNKYQGLIPNADVSQYRVFNGIIERDLQEIIDNAYAYRIVNIDPNIYTNKVVEAIEAYKIDEYTYNIGGKLISRHKFLRNYMAIADKRKDLDIYEVVMYCLIKDSILTDNDIRQIKMAIIALDLSRLKR